MRNKFISLLLILALCLSFQFHAFAATLPTDVPEDAWFAPAVSYVLDAELMDLSDDGSFSPYDTVGIAELLDSITRLPDHEPLSDSASDVLVTRADLAEHFIALFQFYDILSPAAVLDSFADADTIVEDSAEIIQYAVGAGLVKGRDDGTLDLGATVTRAELAQIHLNFAPLLAEKSSAAVALVDKYGNLTLDLLAQNLFNAGFELGDMLTITIGDTIIDAPLCTSYSDVDTGSVVVRAPGGYGTSSIIIAINMGNFSETYKVSEGTTVELEVKEAGAYFNEWELRQLKRTNVREDYESDVVFANFRNVIADSDMAPGVLYRSSSPVNNELGRAAYADRLCEEAGIATVINLANSNEELEAYFEEEDYDSPYYKKLYESGSVICLSMGVDFAADDFKDKLKTGLEFMIENEGPYLIHCTEGKDRAGFVAAILSALMRFPVEDIKADYMLSFVNYYNVEPGSEQYERIAESNIMESLRGIAGMEKGADLSDIDVLEEAVENYLIDIGLTEDQVGALKDILSTIPPEA